MSTECKAAFSVVTSYNSLLIFEKPAWYSNLSNLSDSPDSPVNIVYLSGLCMMGFMYDQRSPWKNQQRQAMLYWKYGWSLWTRSHLFAALCF